MLALGLDLGTSALKALAVDADGRVHARASASYPVERPAPGRAEQSPTRWWAAAASACREVAGRVGAARIGAIGLTGQLNGIVLVDGAGHALGDAIVWLDRRAADELEALRGEIGERVVEATGNGLSPIAVLAKLRWLARHEPQRLASAARVLQPKDYLGWRMTGVAATDPNEASATLLMHLRTRGWDAALVAASGVDPSALSPIAPCDQVVGGLAGSAARECALVPGTPVVVGAGDVGGLAIGCGACDDGTVAVTLGTAGHVVLGARTAPSIDVPGLWRMAHPMPDREIWLGLIMAGGLSAAWARELLAGLGAPSGFDDLEALAARAPPGCRGVTFRPYLEGAATPWDRPDARASFEGLTASHGGPELVRAVYEGVAFNVRACVEAFERAGASVARVRLAEGGARSEFWCRMIADVLGRPVERVTENDTSALGAAILARAGVEGEAVDVLVGRGVVVDRRIPASADHVAVYESAYRRFESSGVT